MANVINVREHDGFSQGNKYFNKLNDILLKYILESVENIVWYDIHDNVCSIERAISLKKSPKDLIVVSWSYYENNKNFTPEHKRALQNMEVCSDNPFTPNNKDGEYLYVENDIPLISYIKEHNVMYLLWDASHRSGDSLINSFNIIIRAFISFCDRGVNPNVFQKIPKKEFVPNKKVPAEKLYLSRDYNAETIKRKIDKDKENLVELSSKFANLNRTIRDNTARLNALLSSSPKGLEILNKNVMHLDIDRNILNVYTKNLFIRDGLTLNKFLLMLNRKKDYKWCPIEEYPDKYGEEMDYDGIHCLRGEDYQDVCEKIKKSLGIETSDKFLVFLGQYKILIDLRNYRLYFKNLTQTKPSCWSEVDNHPHVSNSGDACLGDLTEMVAFAMSENDFALVVDFAIQFLESVNLGDSAGANVVNWPFIKVSEDGSMYDITNEKEFIMPIDEMKFETNEDVIRVMEDLPF